MRGQGDRRCLCAQEKSLTVMKSRIREVPEGAESRVRLKFLGPLGMVQK